MLSFITFQLSMFCLQILYIVIVSKKFDGRCCSCLGPRVSGVFLITCTALHVVISSPVSKMSRFFVSGDTSSDSSSETSDEGIKPTRTAPIRWTRNREGWFCLGWYTSLSRTGTRWYGTWSLTGDHSTCSVKTRKKRSERFGLWRIRGNYLGRRVDMYSCCLDLALSFVCVCVCVCRYDELKDIIRMLKNSQKIRDVAKVQTGGCRTKTHLQI